MKTFKVEIMPCGTKAKTLNRFGKKPYLECNKYYCGAEGGDPVFDDFKFDIDLQRWQQAESERKVYDIYSVVVDGEEIIRDPTKPRDEDAFLESFPAGTIVEATEINTKQIRIL